MFQSARLKLTAWYLLIIILISSLFSIGIYILVNQEYGRIEQIQRRRLERQIQRGWLQKDFDAEEGRNRLASLLILINLGIIAGAGFVGYFLAGRTLKPIKDMVSEQSRFITDASHELRTPITSLKTELEVNLRDKNLPSQLKKILESNLEDVNNLQTLSDSLIRLSQFQKGNSTVFEGLSLKEAISDSIKKVTAIAKNKKIELKDNSKNFYVNADRQNLTELFVIIFDNAIKYSSKNTKVTIDSKKIDHSVIIEIKDQGFGISKEDTEHIFDRFFRADLSRAKDKISGYGLGLSIAKQIIDKHKGTISVESEEGKGTKFSIQLPLSLDE